jgi:prevent-host-death family protein
MSAKHEAWNLQDAKARLSELVDLAKAGKPQVILRRGEPAAAVISYERFQTIEPEETLISFLQEHPMPHGLELPPRDYAYEPPALFADDEE